MIVERITLVLTLDCVIALTQRLVRDLYKILDQVNSEEVPVGFKVPESFNELLSDIRNNQYDVKTFALKLKAMVCFSSFLANKGDF